MQPTVTGHRLTLWTQEKHVTTVLLACDTQSRQCGATKRLENNHWLSDPEQRRNLVCNYLRLLTVPGGDGVVGAEHDVVPVHGMELQRLGGRAMAPCLVAQAYPGLDLLEHLHHGSSVCHVCSVRRSATDWAGPVLVSILSIRRVWRGAHATLASPRYCAGGRDALPCSCHQHRVSTKLEASKTFQKIEKVIFKASLRL